MNEFLAAGVTTNWDERMQKDLLAELAKDNIDPEKLTDKEVVERVSRWLFSRSRHRNMFCTNFRSLSQGAAGGVSGLEPAFDREKGDPRLVGRGAVCS